MAAKRSAEMPHGVGRRMSGRKKERQIIAVALLRAVSAAKATNAEAARWLGISERTMHAWSHLRTPVNVEIVLACPQLRERFREELCVHNHGEAAK